MYFFSQVLFYLFLIINHSINFFLYCALLKSFRRETRRLGRHVRRWPRSVCKWCSHLARQTLLTSTHSEGRTNQRPTQRHHEEPPGDELKHYPNCNNRDKSNGGGDSQSPLLERQKQIALQPYLRRLERQEKEAKQDHHIPSQLKRPPDIIFTDKRSKSGRCEPHPNVRAHV